MNFKDRKDIEIDPIIAPSKSEGPLSRCLWVDIVSAVASKSMIIEMSINVYQFTSLREQGHLQFIYLHIWCVYEIKFLNSSEEFFILGIIVTHSFKVIICNAVPLWYGQISPK